MTSFAGIPPNPTVYVQNLNEKLKKTELKRNLYLLFAQFGNVLEVHCAKTTKLRGQAWIIYDALSGATRAVRELNGVNFFGKEMKLGYARGKSDVTLKIEGAPNPRQNKRKGGQKNTAMTSAPVTTIADKTNGAPAKKAATEGGANRAREKAVEEEEPNQILFVENLPAEMTTMMLSVLFSQYSGYKDTRLVDGKPGIAFVEFDEASQSAIAKEALQNFMVDADHSIKITFARK